MIDDAEKRMDASALIPHDGSAYPGSPYDQIRPLYRGPAAPKGVRITCAMAARLDWSHDGSNDDIVAYEIAYRSKESVQ